MKSIKNRIYVIALFVTFSFCFLLLADAADKPCEQWVARAASVQGTVETRRAGETRWEQVKKDDTFCPGDIIRVKENSRAAIVLSNETNLRLDQNTTVTFAGIETDKTFLLDLLSGALHFFSRFPKSIKVLTPFVNARVEGTEGYIRVGEDKAFLTIFEGKVLASNAAGSLKLSDDQSAVAEANKAPVLRVVVRPRNAVQWALYYPPVIYDPPGESPKEDLSDPRFLTYRTSQLLALGRVDEAEADIKRALSLDPNYSHAFALQSIIALVQNDKDRALNLARKAVEAGPKSATARIAMSYAQQADFDLEKARESVEAAVELDPENALAWARLAELWASFGRLGKSLHAAEKAVELDPNLSRTQMVLGFAYLTQVNTTSSKAAFEKAIELDQADPLSRLGLGLARIREGDLRAGGREIEIAASLDPNNSLVRSYLGKTYFEEKRTGLDEREYAIAKELDPNDPTPWFYNAIAKQTTNRPVEALWDYQKSIELNDNRAVFRSKLMLDSDLAARSAATARVFSDLGFQQRALVEGWNAVNTDPTNFSAHRFLADSYSILPRHEIARVSELLQSQLLQPLNITSIQPRLAESNQFLISAGGPAGQSFREFNPLFNRNRLAFQGSGLRGENDTRGLEGIGSGIYKKFSFSSGYTYFDTDGWRDNADQTDKIANVFAQMQFTHKTSIQAEYRYRDTENGDLQLRFFQDDFLSNLSEDVERKTARLGFRHAFSPGSDLIGNFQYQNADGGFRDEPDPVLTIDSEADADSYGGELQYLFRSQYLNIVSGLGYFDIDAKEDLLTELNLPFPPGPIIVQESFDRDVNHTNLYAYSNINLPANVTLTIGGSGDFFNSDSSDTPEEDQFNPKFGITWNPFPNTTLRAAAFRTLKRTLITDQTLEPTQVAGFNQFFDDVFGTDAWRYGGAIDWKFSKNIYAGAEFSYRDLEVPWFDLVASELKEVDWEEYLGRGYLFWTPHKWLALSAEYLYENLERDEDFADGAKEVETHYLPLGINFFHPSGLSASLKGTYIDQDGKFERQGTLGTFEDGDDNFWLVDAAIRYRLPKRYGFITVGATNLFDEEFQFFDSDRDNPRIIPDRFFFARVTLAIP
jgi:tetratricopeptide (TPR) repeat protein